MKTVNYSLASNFVDFALSDVTLHWKKLEGWLGAWTSFYKTQTLWADTEQGTLSSTGIENRGIPRVIGL